jgi:exosortase H (IPTLxxWG-CTERM-specific)
MAEASDSPSTVNSERTYNPAIVFAGNFALFAVLGTLLLMNGFVVDHIVGPFTRALVQISAALLRLFGSEVSTNQNILAFVNGPGAVAVADGCNAVQVCMLLSCGILAFPATATYKLIGIVLGIFFVQVINVVRIVSLLFLSGHAPDLFDFFHLYVWDAFIVIDAMLVFVVWARYADAKPT